MNTLKKLLFVSFSLMLSFTITHVLLADGHENCKPSKWGAEDELGAANYINEKRTKLAANLIKQGKSHPLGITINSKTPAFPPRTLSLTVMAPNQNTEQILREL